MDDKDVRCSACDKGYRVHARHAGHGDQEYLYCDRCHRVAVLNIYSPASDLLLQLSNGRLWSWRERKSDQRKIESAVSQCPCGGNFKFDAVPSCPECNTPIELKDLAGKVRDVSLQGLRGWRGYYYLVVNGGRVDDPLGKAEEGVTKP